MLAVKKVTSEEEPAEGCNMWLLFESPVRSSRAWDGLSIMRTVHHHGHSASFEEGIRNLS